MPFNNSRSPRNGMRVISHSEWALRARRSYASLRISKRTRSHENKIRGKLPSPPSARDGILELFCFLGQLLCLPRNAHRDVAVILHANRITFTLNPAAVRTRAPRNKSGLHLLHRIERLRSLNVRYRELYTHTYICCQNWKKTYRFLPLNWNNSSNSA